MKRIIAIILVLTFPNGLQAATSCDLDKAKGSIPIIDYKNPVLDHQKGFLEGGKSSCRVSLDYNAPMRVMNRHYSEKGQYQGVDYEVFFNRGNVEVSSAPDGKNSTTGHSKWLIRCKYDEMEEIKTCSMNKDGFLFIHLGSDGESTSFGLIVETYPNTEVAVKVGKNSKVSANSMNALMMKPEIVNQMKTSNKLITSYYKWPSQVKKVDKHTIDGFAVALTLMRKLHKESTFY